MDMDSYAERSALAARRSQGYWLLSRLFLNVPDRTHLLALQTELGSAGDGALGDLARQVERALSVPDEAAVEFTRRLVAVSKGSGEVLPYESFLRDGTVPGAATEQVLNCMAEVGFTDVAPEAPSPDHIGAELRFMALLCYEESQAWASDQVAAEWLLQRQRRFLNEHLAVWAVDYCAALAARCTEGYMKAVAQLAHASLREDLELVDDLCAELT